MTSRVQQQRAEASNTPPPANTLLPGQLYVELADPMKLWAGVPASLNASQAKVLFDSTAYLLKSGGQMTGTLTLANTPPGPQDAITKSYVDGATGAAVPLAGGTMTGPLILSGNPTQALGAAPKQYVDTMVPLAGGTMTGLLTLSGDPTTPLGSATKRYVDTMVPLAGGTMSGLLTLSGDPIVSLGAVTKQYVDNRPSVTVGDTPPGTPLPGAMWWNSTDGQLYIRYQDPTSTAWVIANQSGGLTDAPNDTNTYGRHAQAWTPVATQAALQATTTVSAANTGRNLVLNPVFNVWQRGAGPFTGALNYAADRWMLLNGVSTLSVSLAALTDADRAAIGDEAAFQALQATVGGTSGAGDYAMFIQRIEGARRTSGKTVTLSFWARATSGTPKIGYEFYQSVGTGGSPSPDVTGIGSGATPALSTTWTRYSMTVAVPSIAGKTFGTTSGTDYLAVDFWLSAGSTYNTRAGGIGVQSGTIQLWGVQLEVVQPGQTQPSALDYGGTPQQQLAQCQRFARFIAASIRGAYPNGSFNTCCTVTWPDMRATPTATLAATGSNGNASSASLVPLNSNSAYFNLLSGAAGDAYVLGYSYLLSADL